MCGICGFLHKHNIEKRHLKAMNDTIIYRGPDDEGYYISTIENGYQLGLAQRRLSILDLSPAGHQPMQSEDGEVVVTYNGEIYNFQSIKNELQKSGYKFKSNCDTEILVYAYKKWGIDCVKRLNGMFAFALYDREKNEFYLCRDRMGVKPLYYYLNGQDIVFASELKPIIHYPYFNKELNMHALGLFLGHMYIAGSDSIFKNVHKLLPGTYLKWQSGFVSITEYWSVKNLLARDMNHAYSYEEAIEVLDDLLTDAVAMRMVSDVPIGAFLSGGYDSSLVSAIMQEQSNKPIKTFTIGFHEDKYNEAAYAESVADYIGSEHQCAYLSVEDAKKMVYRLPDIYDEPMADSSQLATILLSEITKKKVTVALSGDGGDELFGGYPSYNRFSELEKYRKISRLLNHLDRIVDLKRYLPRHADLLYYFDSDEHIMDAVNLVFWAKHPNILNGFIPSDCVYHNIYNSEFDPVTNYMLRDLLTYLPEDILTKVDRASMSVSLECRTPLLDYRVAEFALSMPLEYKYHSGIGKRILKDVAHRHIDKKILERSKKGFCVPIEQWLHQDFQRFTNGLFEKAYIEKQGVFSYSEIQRMLSIFSKNKDKAYGTTYLWGIFVFQLWWDRWMK